MSFVSLIPAYIVIGLVAGALNFRRRWGVAEEHTYFFEGTGFDSACRNSCREFKDVPDKYKSQKSVWNHHLEGTYVQSVLVTLFWLALFPVAIVVVLAKGISGLWNLALPEDAKKVLK